MNENRNFGVTEARIGLTLITCLLVTLGFVIVQRLSGSPSSTTATTLLQPTYGNAADSGVRTALGESPSQPAEHQTSYAPQWLEPQSASASDTITR